MPVLVARRRLRVLPMSVARVRVRAERMLEAVGRADAELSILLCDDRAIRDLNRDYRAKDRPTDVLAFPLDDRRVLGDVAISVDTARRQARRAGRTISAEITMLLAHGLLHLLGFDHRDAAEERRMKAKTDLLVAAARPPRAPR